MNHLWSFQRTSVYSCLKHQKVTWNFSILWTYLNIALSNLSIPRRSSSSNPTQHTSVIKLRNHKWTQSLSQVTVHLPLIKQLHHHRVMWESMHRHLLNRHILPTSLLPIFIQGQLWIHWVITCILYLNLHLCTLIILQITLSRVLPLSTLHLFWIRIDLSTKLVLHNQHVLSFKNSMTGSLNIHRQQRTIPVCLYLLRFFLTSLVILPS